MTLGMGHIVTCGRTLSGLGRITLDLNECPLPKKSCKNIKNLSIIRIANPTCKWEHEDSSFEIFKLILEVRNSLNQLFLITQLGF